MINKLLTRTDFGSYEDFYANFTFNVPPNFNFGFDIVDAITAEDPSRRAMVWCNDSGAERVFTMADMTRLSNQAANYFAAQGIRKGDFVMLILKRRWQYWPAVVGLHKLGAIAIPATALLTKKDIVYRCKAADVKMIVAVNEPGIRGAIEAAGEEVEIPIKALVDVATASSRGDVNETTAGCRGYVNNWLDFDAGMKMASEHFPRPADAACGEDIMLLYFTSGTTGMPKMVALNHLYPLGHIATARYWQNCQLGGLHFTVAETGWAKTAWGKLYGQWIAGSAVMTYDFDTFNAEKLLRVVEKYRVTTFCAPPTMYRYFIKENLRAFDFSALKWCVVAGEPLNPEVFEQFKAATGFELREGYGQTELTVALGTFPWLKPKPGSMGRPAPGYDIDLVDENGRPCEVGEEGEIVVRTDRRKPFGIFNGYYRDDALTSKVWNNGLYHTGDTAWRDADGYYWFVGRLDDVIKSAGYRIGPFEVESALVEHKAVLECAVTGVPDEERGAVVKATVVLAKGFTASEALKKELQNHVKSVTAPYKYPRIIEFADVLPKTISGKIRRVEIRAKDQK